MSGNETEGERGVKPDEEESSPRRFLEEVRDLRLRRMKLSY